MDMKQYFVNHLLYDKEFAEDLIERYPIVISQFGIHLFSHHEVVWGKDTEDLQEIYDFIDGNGFIVEVDEERIRDENDYYIKITIVYEEEEENEPPTIEWPSFTWTSFSEYYTATEETYTQAKEESARQKTSAPVWFYSDGCLELLRVVPSRGRLCAKVPRPP